MSKIAYKIPEAADMVSVSESTVRRAIKATDPKASPPPLRAKNIGSDERPDYRILHKALEAWADSLKDA